MESFDELKSHILSKFEFLFKDFYSMRGTTIKLFSDNKETINICNERLKIYFSSFCLPESNTMNIYSLKSNKIKSLISKLRLESLNWNQVKHMGEYYFNAKSIDFSVSVWANKNHNNFDNTLFPDYVNGNQHICILINDLENRFFYLYNDIDDYTILTPLRIIRGLMVRPLLKTGFIYFHAAAIKYKNRGYLLCGKSGSGKTSTLLNFLSNKDGELIANDKVFIGIEGNDIKIFGWDSVATIGVGNLNQYGQLKKFLTNIDDITCIQDMYGYMPKQEYLDLTSEEMKSLKNQGNKLAIPQYQLAELFNKKIIPKQKLDAIILIDLEWNCKEKQLIKLESLDKTVVLNDNILKVMADQLNWMGYPLLLSNDSICKEIVSSIDFYKYQSSFQDSNLTSFLEVL
jgi:hypothetical protein